MFKDFGGFVKQFQREGIDGDNFSRGLEVLAESGICSGCKAEIPDYSKGERDRCEIRQCCFEKEYPLCSNCASFPCPKLKSNPGVIKWRTIENLETIEKIGIKQWIDSQWKDYTSNA